MAKKNDNRIVLKTPVGRLSFPYLTKKDEGRQYSDGKFKTDLLFTKEQWKTEGKELTTAVLEVAKKHFGKAVKLKDFKHPFVDTDTVNNIPDNMKGMIRIRAKSTNAPQIVGPDKKPLTAEKIAEIKGGDYARLVVSVFPYDQQGGGVSLGLNFVQFARPGEPFGQGTSKMLDMLDEMEVTLEDGIEESESSESEEDDLAFA